MPQTISEFHYTMFYIDGGSLASTDALHQELAFKLGLPVSYDNNWHALLQCLSSIDNPASNLCAHWEFQTGKYLVLQVRQSAATTINPAVLTSLVTCIADANKRLSRSGQGVSIWLEFTTDDK